MTLPTNSADRKDIPLTRGVLDYFPDALIEIARLSRVGNDKHNPGQVMHHARDKSTDHADCILRHLVDRGKIDPEDGQLHSTKVAWRALALLQEELEANHGAMLPRGAAKLELPTLDWFESGTTPEALTWTDDCGTDTRMVPVITSIEDSRECGNNIDQRIAGDTQLAKKLKNEYYRDLYIDGVYDTKTGEGGSGFTCCLLLGFEDGGDAIFRPWGLPNNHTEHPDRLIPVRFENHWDSADQLRKEVLASV